MLSLDMPVSLTTAQGALPRTDVPAFAAAAAAAAATSKAARIPVQAVASSNGVASGFSSGDAAQTSGSNPTAAAKDHHVWVVTGPAGCGKSTVAQHISDALGLPFIEGDDYHPKSNVEKMSNGIPLTDADRWDWLTILRDESIRKLKAAGSDGVVLTCSALKRKYRDVIRVAPYFAPDLHLHFIFLHAPEEVLLERVSARPNHFMGANMVHSQFQALEPPMPDETDVITVDVSVSPELVKARVLDSVLGIARQAKEQKPQ